MKRAGRPSSFKPEHAKTARKVARLGATDVEIADVLGISVATLYRWKNEHPSFCEALKAGKEAADAAVETSLYRRATGYSHAAVKIFMPAGAESPVYAPYTEHFAPDTTACIFWLKNRKPEEWRDRQEVKHSGGVTISAEALAGILKRSNNAA